MSLKTKISDLTTTISNKVSQLKNILDSEIARVYTDLNAVNDSIPTNNNQLTNGAGYISTVKTVNNQTIEGTGNIDTNAIILRDTNTITYDLNANHGTRAVPRTGTLTQSFTGAVIGRVIKIYYNGSAVPNLTGWSYGGTDANFTANVTCIIYLEFEGSETVMARLQKS